MHIAIVITKFSYEIIDTWGNQVPFTAHTAVFTIMLEVEQMHIIICQPRWSGVDYDYTSSGSGDPEQLARNNTLWTWFVYCGMYKQ